MILPVLLAITLPLLVVCRVVYNLCFHPLRGFPGPRAAAATSWWKAYKEVWKKETLAQELFRLHATYGDVVRIAPNELHFGDPAAFHDIYNATKRWDKDEGLYTTPGVRSGSFVFLKYKQAKERRDVLQPMFSKRAMDNVEPLIWKNASTLASAITRKNAAKKSIDLLFAFRSFTLDTIMGFTFGNCLHALAAPDFRDPLILAMDSSLSAIPLLRNFPLLRKMVFSIPPHLVTHFLPDSKALGPRIYQVRTMIQSELAKVLRDPRKLDEAPHQTIFHRMLNADSYKNNTVPDYAQLQDEGLTIIFAGANTVATALVMGHWNLLNHAEDLARLKRELHGAWPDIEKPPTLKELEALPVLTATIKETLRHMPSGVSLTRTVPPGGAMISGRHIPPGTTVGMIILHVHQSEKIFKDALDFKPQRWLEEGAGELEQWLVPFSRGPRMCFGRNLAWAEMYIALATMVRKFDMTLDGMTPEDMEWRECIEAYFPRRHLHAWCEPVV
ncbi:hypothetical protein MPDQ_000759 [Monascus purpureus]|uniref:Cytochrome P450 monooxygenase n=1 Tax=Monascus purpureus TaxID=5098 RepID=A0A507QT80_MONPU|nr:hypothetical protein MPDQ_000759 [Monascus purpureus]BDD59948.1 hypothetical protein MAP00_005116 [Monascus purpureus]